MNKKNSKNLEESLKKILNDTLGDLIAKEKTKKISQRTQANKIGIDVASLSKYVNGKQLPSADALYKIAKYYNCSTDFLLGMSDVKTPDCEVIAISKKLGLSEKAIEKLKEYHNDNFYKGFEYMQVINFLIENTDFNELEKIDRFLFIKPTHFLIKDSAGKEYVNSNYISLCSEMGEYQFEPDDILQILRLDIEKLLSKLQTQAQKVKRNRIVQFIETKEENEIAKTIIGESKNGKHSTKKKQGR